MSRLNRTKPYGVLLVTGAQTHQENYARALAADKRCRLVALSDERSVTKRRRDLNERLARELNVPHVPELDDALKLPDVDLVSVCAEPERRGPIIVRCARAGKHLYLDKSLVPTLADADAIVAAVRAASVRSHMFSFITQSWARWAKQVIDSGELGELSALHADFHFAKGRTGTAKLGAPRREQYPPDPTTFQRIEAKREMDNVAVYAVSLIRWLVGREVRTVCCRTANYFFAEHQRNGAEDFGVMLLTLEGGLTATVSAGRIGWTSHPGNGTNRVIVVGSRRTIAVDAASPRVEIYTDETPWTPPPVNPADPMGFWSSTQQEVHTMPKLTWSPLAAGASDAAYFIDCLDDDRDSEMNAAAAAATTEVLLAGYKSAATGQVVSLPLNRGA
jgi:predicted dehydrogenase